MEGAAQEKGMQTKGLDWWEDRKDIIGAAAILLAGYMQITIFGDKQNELLLTGAIKIKIAQTIDALTCPTELKEQDPELVALASKLVELIPSSCIPLKMPLNTVIGVCSLNPIFDNLTALRIAAIEYLSESPNYYNVAFEEVSLTQKSENIVEAIRSL